MGFLTVGRPLTSEKMKDKSKYIREHGVKQFLNIWKKWKDIDNDELRFGDEIEYGIFYLNGDENDESRKVQLSVRGTEIRESLNKLEIESSHESEGATWHPEFGAWMIESTPSRPYTNYASDLIRVERNMIVRRRRLYSSLEDNEVAPTMVSFPMLGTKDFIRDPKPFNSPHSKSIFVPDYIINPHPRFAALVENIREHRGSKVKIEVPLFQDECTEEYQSFKEFDDKNNEVKPSIYMDAMAFGMGMSCLQVTFQARNIQESRYMYDQLTVLAPIMLAITAASPIFKGRLANIDTRWDIIANSVDCRNPVERGEQKDEETVEKYKDSRLAGNGTQYIAKSRYDSVSRYIYYDPTCDATKALEKYNDLNIPYDEEIKNTLEESGVDSVLATHIAQLFTRDPLVAFEDSVEELNDNEVTDHFESIQSTNWQTCRWKPPPKLLGEKNHIGWRTEFRSMEVQPTDFENAAFTVFVVLITRVILAFNLSLYIPLSKVDANMHRAQQRNAYRDGKFYFRKYINPAKISSSGVNDKPVACDSLRIDDSFEEMTLEEIFNGKGEFPGLIPLISVYLDYIKCDTFTYKRVNEYLDFIELRSRGILKTPASWIRQFVAKHPDYKKDSEVNHSIAYDLVKEINDIGLGHKDCRALLGDIKIKKISKDFPRATLPGNLSNIERNKLLSSLLELTSRESFQARRLVQNNSFRGEELCEEPSKAEPLTLN